MPQALGAWAKNRHPQRRQGYLNGCLTDATERNYPMPAESPAGLAISARAVAS